MFSLKELLDRVRKCKKLSELIKLKEDYANFLRGRTTEEKDKFAEVYNTRFRRLKYKR